MQIVQTNWFKNRTAAMLAEIPLQRNRAHADVEVTRKLNCGEYHLGEGPLPVPGEASRTWNADGRLELTIVEASQ